MGLQVTFQVRAAKFSRRSRWSPGGGLDVLGFGYDAITDEQRAAVIQVHPRPNFTEGILAAFTEGFKGWQETSFGNVKADVLEHFVPRFKRGDFVEVIQQITWPEQVLVFR